MKKLHEKGFSIPIILVVIVLAAASFGTWYIVNKRNNKKVDITASQKQEQEAPQAQQTADPSENGKYLVIKEWGVRFEIPEKQRGDIEYFMNDTAQRLSGGPIVLDITSKSFSNGSLKCAEVENTSRSLITINRQQDSEGVTTTDPAPFKQIGNNRYYFTTTSCEEAIERNGSQGDKQLIQELKRAISETLESS